MSAFDIDTLVDDMEPVRRVSQKDALALVAVTTCIAVAVIAMRFGLREDLFTLQLHPIVILRAAMLLLLGFAALTAVMASARPGIGQVSNGWRWALGAVAMFPVTAIVTSILRQELPLATLQAQSGPWCLGISFGGALLIGSALTFWLRRGAATSLARVGWLVGLAAGSFGTFAFSLHCPSTTVDYIGIWYSLAVALSAGIGRMIVPPLIRW